jgi:hypothetical protein
MQRVRSRLARVPVGWWVVLLVLPALAPLARQGFFESHDGIFHVHRLAALDRAVRAGVLYPRWFPEFAFGYGQPVLNFYGPLSYYWGLPFTLLGLDAVLATKLILGTGLIASALALYALARLYVDRLPALVAACLYAYLPYHLLDLYVRGAVAEFLAFVWFPLILLAFHRLLDETAGRRWITWLAIAGLALAALILTHSLSALLFAPVLAAYLLFRLAVRRDVAAVGRLALAVALAVTLSAFYWLPVLAESQYVGLGSGISEGYQRHLLSAGALFSPDLVYSYEARDPVTFSLGWVQGLIMLAALGLPFVRRVCWPAILFLAVALASAWMLTTASQPAWQALEPVLAYLQYPWRFQALAALACAMLAGFLLQALGGVSRPGMAAAGIALLAVTGAWALADLPFTPTRPALPVEQMWAQDRETGQVGTTWTGEYLPIWVQEQRWALSQPLRHPADEYDAPDVAQGLSLTGVGYTHYQWRLESEAETGLVLHQFYYPGWEARWQGRVIPAQPLGSLGLAAFRLPPGEGILSLRLALTPAQRWGSLVSLLAALAVAVLLVARFQQLRIQRSLRAASGLLALSIPYLFLAAILLGSLAQANGYLRAPVAANADLANRVRLQAYELPQERYRPGDVVTITLYWIPLAHLDEEHKTFIHLTDVDLTRQPAQHDGDPGRGFTPTARWLPGELVPDGHALSLPRDLAPGRYLLWAGMYEFPSLQNLAVVSSDLAHDGTRVLLGEIEVEAP